MASQSQQLSPSRGGMSGTGAGEVGGVAQSLRGWVLTNCVPQPAPRLAPSVRRAPGERWAKRHHPCLASRSGLVWEHVFCGLRRGLLLGREWGK